MIILVFGNEISTRKDLTGVSKGGVTLFFAREDKEPPTQRTTNVSFPLILGCYVTKCAPLKTLKLIALSELTFDERVVVHRVAPERENVWPSKAVTWPFLQPLYRNVQWFRGGLVFEARRLLYHSAQGSRTLKDL